jgi:creatinine amidohydrolase
MRLSIVAFALVAAQLPAAVPATEQPQSPPAKSQRLEDIAWPEAERLLTPDAVVVIPLGAASKEHGPHLALGNDRKLADYLTNRVIDSNVVVVAPTLTYHYYPAFLEYPGSTSLTLDTAREHTVEVVRSLARYGPRRFYILNTGISTLRALQPAAAALAGDGLLLRYTAFADRIERAARGIREQAGGTHADEIETSMMLYIDPSSVDMSKAVKDYRPSSGALRLTRTPGGEGTFSPTGIWGDPTLATRDKGRAFVEALVAAINEDIQGVRTAPLPARTQTAPVAPATNPPAAVPAPPGLANRPGDPCTPRSYRAIAAIGDAFAAAWANADAEKLGRLWSAGGNIVHTDGSVERGPEIITQNRRALFRRTEYRGSRHPVTFTMIRCLAEDIAIVDGKWELRGLRDAGGRPAPPMQGQVTVVAKRLDENWLIEAYRYTVAAAK